MHSGLTYCLEIFLSEKYILYKDSISNTIVSNKYSQRKIL